MKKGAISTGHSILLILIIIGVIITIVAIVFRGEFLESDNSLLSKVDLDLKIENVEVLNENSVKVTLICEKAKENLIGMRFIFEKPSGSETVDVNYPLKEDEEAEFTISLEKITSDNLESVKVYPIMELENQELSVGSIKDEYTRFYN